MLVIQDATEARSKLYALIDETTDTHQPIVITGKRGNAVLLAEDDWKAITIKGVNQRGQSRNQRGQIKGVRVVEIKIKANQRGQSR